MILADGVPHHPFAGGFGAVAFQPFERRLDPLDQALALCR
jgi:hypothetical protein